MMNLKKWCSRLSEDEIAEFLPKTERKKCKNTQNIADVIEEYLQEKTSVYILRPCWEIGQGFEESLRGGKLVKNLEIFWMNNKTINSAFVWMLSALVDNILLDLHNSSHHTQATSNNC